jgi:NRPS condensation-like uncharacterized protein
MKFRAEVFDQIQWLFKANGFNDHQLHCLLRFERGLDLALLRQAVAASIAAVPILCSRYVPGANPCWESIDPKLWRSWSSSSSLRSMKASVRNSAFARLPRKTLLSPSR